MPGSPVEIDATALIDIRDKVAAARDLVMCVCLACSSPVLPRDERAALSQLGMTIRERLTSVESALDQLAPHRPPRG